MVNDNLAQGARAAHDWGLASWLGGSMFGQFALNPAVATQPFTATWPSFASMPRLRTPARRGR